MIVVLPVLGLALLALPACLAGIRRRIPTVEFARLTTASLAFGTAVLLTGLLVLAFPAFVRVFAVLVAWPTCPHVLTVISPGGSVLSTIAAVVSTALIVSMIHEVVRTRRNGRLAVVEQGLGEHTSSRDFELVVLPTDALIAYNTGRDGQIVVSRGLVDTLDERELAGVISHERAHAELGHAQLITLVRVLEHALGWMPHVARSAHVVRSAIEQRADELATGTRDENRAVLRRALLRVAAQSSADDVLHREADERSAVLHATVRPSSVLRLAGSVPVALGAMLPAWITLDWLSVSHHALELAGYCPH